LTYLYVNSERWNGLRAEYLSYQRRLQALYEAGQPIPTDRSDDDPWRYSYKEEINRRSGASYWESCAVDKWEHKELSPEPPARQTQRSGRRPDEQHLDEDFPEGTVVFVKGLSPSSGRRALRDMADSIVHGTGKVEYVDLEAGLDAVSLIVFIIRFLLSDLQNTVSHAVLNLESCLSFLCAFLKSVVDSRFRRPKSIT
jgi:hypothetical protein